MSDFIRVGGVQRLQDGEFIVQVSVIFRSLYLMNITSDL